MLALIQLLGVYRADIQIVLVNLETFVLKKVDQGLRVGFNSEYKVRVLPTNDGRPQSKRRDSPFDISLKTVQINPCFRKNVGPAKLV